MAETHFTLVFAGNLRDFPTNPFKTKTPFGTPTACAVGDAFAEKDALEEENERLRAIFPKILEALGNGAGCGPAAPLEFLEVIPDEVRFVVSRLANMKAEPHVTWPVEQVVTEAQIAEAQNLFAGYFRRNYPGPDTIIGKPDWHSPRLFRAALHALRCVSAIKTVSEAGR